MVLLNLHAMVYFSLTKKVLMATEIYLACFGFKNKD